MGIISRIFGGKTETDVVELLTSHHTAIDELFKKLEDGEGDKRATFSDLADLLAAHATIEEKIFYPAVMAKDTKGLLHESVEEHLGIKRMLADLVTKNLDDDTFKAKLTVLKEYVSHHAHHEEEKKLFPLVLKSFDADQRAALGNEVLVMFLDLMEASPSKNVASETGASAPLPKP
jgi:hemerythrin-like domain-containing protein